MKLQIYLSLQVSLTISTEYLTFRELKMKRKGRPRSYNANKELNPGNITLPCIIGNFNFYGMADLDASVNLMPRNIFEYLRLANLRNTNMLAEMADMTKKATLGRPFIATIHAEINVFDKEISLGINKDRVSHDMEKKDHNFTT
ncbi:hypothetical protein Tco_1520932, partial [Tanacetum coccineum]